MVKMGSLQGNLSGGEGGLCTAVTTKMHIAHDYVICSNTRCARSAETHTASQEAYLAQCAMISDESVVLQELLLTVHTI